MTVVLGSPTRSLRVHAGPPGRGRSVKHTRLMASNADRLLRNYTNVILVVQTRLISSMAS
jgi:hypothetical protein